MYLTRSIRFFAFVKHITLLDIDIPMNEIDTMISITHVKQFTHLNITLVKKH